MGADSVVVVRLAAEQEPVDYWKMGFPPTQAVEEINEKARRQKEGNRAFQENEAG